MSNFFKATHRTTGEVVSFGLEDIWFDFETGVMGEFNRCSIGVQTREDPVAYSDSVMNKKHFEHGSIRISDWLKDYQLQYHHAGEYYDYQS